MPGPRSFRQQFPSAGDKRRRHNRKKSLGSTEDGRMLSIQGYLPPLIFFKVAIIALAILAIVMSNSTPDSDGYANATATSSFAQKVDSIYNARLVPKDWSFITIVLFVNFPQIIITLIYAIYNNTLSRMLLASEYNSYATERKPLRVSFPSGQQRSTYYLFMPYKYTVPFLLLFTLAHWLTSEALSFAQLIPVTVKGDFTRSGIQRGISVSSLGLKIMVIPELLAVIVIFALMMRKFKSPHMPIAMNCSAAISAACHCPAEDTDAAEKPVQWGEVGVEVQNLKTSRGFNLPDIETECRHCSFTSLEVKDPISSVAY
ncbi:hypothetical protein N7454_006998 [Penicillium verhagenii]|nr:hypothetical protein N7454_006998 [Penicillium verhagenii]